MASTQNAYSFGAKRMVTLALVICSLILAGTVNLFIQRLDVTGQDIFYSYVEGNRLRVGENPYDRVLEGDMLHNQKYATYFPVFYELSYVSQELGLSSFSSWIEFWRLVFTVFEFGIAILLYLALAHRHLDWLGVFAAAFWLLNRWTLAVVEIADLDFMPIFFLLLSLQLFPRQRWLSLFLFSTSLSLKQVSVFLVPLYLLWLWQSSGSARLKTTVLGALAICSVPLTSALPFLLWNANGFLKSILFSVTRLGEEGGFPAHSLGVYLGGATTLERGVMFCLMGLLYYLAWRTYRRKYGLALLVMFTFISFNPVLFVQYFVWLIPLILLAICDTNDIAAAALPDAGRPANNPIQSS